MPGTPQLSHSPSQSCKAKRSLVALGPSIKEDLGSWDLCHPVPLSLEFLVPRDRSSVKCGRSLSSPSARTRAAPALPPRSSRRCRRAPAGLFRDRCQYPGRFRRLGPGDLRFSGALRSSEASVWKCRCPETPQASSSPVRVDARHQHDRGACGRPCAAVQNRIRSHPRSACSAGVFSSRGHRLTSRNPPTRVLVVLRRRSCEPRSPGDGD